MQSTHPIGRRRDDGSSFIEILVSIVLLGTAGIAVLTAVGAAATGAATHRSIATAQAAVSAAADELAGASTAFRPCASADDYGRTLPSDLGVSVVDVEHWQSGAWESSCDPVTDTLHRVTLEARSGERGTATLSVVKRRPSDPNADYVMNQDTGGGAPVVPTGPTPGIDGTTTTTTTVPPTTVPPSTVPTTTVPGPRPTCTVERIRTNSRWMDTISLTVRNDTPNTYDWTDWSVQLRYEGVGVEQNGFFVSTWDADVLTLTPAWSWLPLRDDSSRDVTILEPGGSLRRVDEADIECSVVVP